MVRGLSFVGLMAMLSFSPSAQAGSSTGEAPAATSPSQSSAPEDSADAFAWLDELMQELEELLGGK